MTQILAFLVVLLLVIGSAGGTVKVGPWSFHLGWLGLAVWALVALVL